MCALCNGRSTVIILTPSLPPKLGDDNGDEYIIGTPFTALVSAKTDIRTATISRTGLPPTRHRHECPPEVYLLVSGHRRFYETAALTVVVVLRTESVSLRGERFRRCRYARYVL